MKKNVMERIAVMSACYGHYSFGYFLRSMQRFGVRHIEIWGGSPHICSDDRTLNRVTSLKQKTDALGMDIIAYTPEQVQYPYNIAAQESDIRSKSIDYFKKNIDITAALQSPIMLINAGWGYLDEAKEAAWDRSRTSLRHLALYAKEQGVMLALEVLTKISSNLINYSYELAKMISEVNEPSMKGMIDVGQMSILGETIANYFDALGEPPVHIHIMDGQPAAHLALGDGILPVKSYIDEVIVHGYEGIFSMEINDRRYFLEPDKAIEQSLDTLTTWYP
jgi:protein FrlC